MRVKAGSRVKPGMKEVGDGPCAPPPKKNCRSKAPLHRRGAYALAIEPLAYQPILTPNAPLIASPIAPWVQYFLFKTLLTLPVKVTARPPIVVAY